MIVDRTDGELKDPKIVVNRLRALADRMEKGEELHLILAFLDGTKSDVTMLGNDESTGALMITILKGLEKRGMAMQVGKVPAEVFMGKPSRDVN